MSRLARVELSNWKRYRGEHAIDLGAGVYAVTAEFDGDADRSNWAGKTALLGAIRFAAYGEHDARVEDEWITRGEAAGGVAIQIDDGTRVARTRKRGASTQLVVTTADGKTMGGVQAQEWLVQKIGLGLDDFDASCWFGQKQISRLVTARPADRMAVVAGWLGLEPLQRCEDRARAILKERTDGIATLSSKLDGVRQTIERLAVGIPRAPGDSLDEAFRIASELAYAEKLRTEALRTDAEAVADGARAAAERARTVAKVEQLRADSAALTSKIKQVGGPRAVVRAEESKAAHGAALSKRAAAGEELKRRVAVVGGMFDGACPVLRGFACPAQAEINGQRDRLSEERFAAQTAYDDECRAEAVARADAETAARTAQEALSARERRTLVTEQIAALEADLAAAPVVLAAAGLLPVEEARAAATMAASQYEQIDRRLGQVGELSEEARVLEARIAEASKAAALARAATVVFGRRGAQRVVAERALAVIERGANELLRASGIDLTVTMRWAREGAGLATTCEACGAAFPASAKVKRCGCGAERGPKMVERLDVDLSDRSGAADDLVGAALQLSAAAWLRRERGASWSVALIDEPFASLDATNRKAFARHLATMLTGSYGFEQAFVVAHQADAIDALPKRLEIAADDERTWIAGAG